jgi:hypothetical protein
MKLPTKEEVEQMQIDLGCSYEDAYTAALIMIVMEENGGQMEEVALKTEVNRRLSLQSMN